MSADLERVARAVRAAQKSYIQAPDSDRALNNFDYERVGIEAAMRETRRIDAEALRDMPYPEGYEPGDYYSGFTDGRFDAAEWLKGRSNDD